MINLNSNCRCGGEGIHPVECRGDNCGDIIFLCDKCYAIKIKRYGGKYGSPTPDEYLNNSKCVECERDGKLGSLGI